MEGNAEERKRNGKSEMFEEERIDAAIFAAEQLLALTISDGNFWSDPTRETPFHCDICSERSDICGTGGGCMIEKDGSTTYACASCVSEFCDISPEERARRYGAKVKRDVTDRVLSREYYRSLAFRSNIGCDEEVVCLLSLFRKDVPFSHSMAYVKRFDDMCLPTGTIEVTICAATPNGNGMVRTKTVPKDDCSFVRTRCWGCPNVVGYYNTTTCERCETAVYCSKACMKRHSVVHTPCCDHVHGMLSRVLKKIGAKRGPSECLERSSTKPKITNKNIRPKSSPSLSRPRRTARDQDESIKKKYHEAIHRDAEKRKKKN